MSEVSFLLNGTQVRLDQVAPTRSLLDWLRETRGLRGTKEGCNEGDCGACTVLLRDATGTRAVNACVMMLGHLDGKALRTVEGISGPKGELHPVQAEMIRHHASQCGFCTPGFVASLAAAHSDGTQNYDEALAGNLCRCTGYAPILRAAKAAEAAPVPSWLTTDSLPAPVAPVPLRPRTLDELLALTKAEPELRMIAGATDLALWQTKGLKDLGRVVFLDGVAELRRVLHDAGVTRVGAGVTLRDLREIVGGAYPAFAAMLGRFASAQIRNVATLGGNIANGSPIGDAPPVLIALDATLTLRFGEAERQLPIEEFFIEYGRQDRAKGEVLTQIAWANTGRKLHVAKLSKRRDQDISAVLAALSYHLDDGRMRDLRLAFGGMAGVPKRALAAEAVLEGAEVSAEVFAKAAAALPSDFTPLSDMRASAGYRMEAAQGILQRFGLEAMGHAVDLGEVTP